MQCSLARILLLLALAVGAGASAWPIHAQSHSRAEIEVLAEYYARYYGVPITLVRRVMGGTNFDPAARNGPYYGLMQILPEVASTMGYSDPPEGLLNAETNLIYAVKYLRGAWLLSGGNESRAAQLYATGYFDLARDAGLLEETGLLPGPRTVPTAQPVGVEGAVTVITPYVQAQLRPPGNTRTLLRLELVNDTDGPTATPEETSVAVAQAVTDAEPADTPAMTVALDIPPPRPSATPDTEMRDAVAASHDAETSPETPTSEPDPTLAQLSVDLEWASAHAHHSSLPEVDEDAGLLETTFALLDVVQDVIARSNLAAGEAGFLPPLRPDEL